MNEKRRQNGQNRVADNLALEIIHAVSFVETPKAMKDLRRWLWLGSDLDLLELLENGTSVFQFLFVSAPVLVSLFHHISQTGQIANQIFG